MGCIAVAVVFILNEWMEEKTNVVTFTGIVCHLSVCVSYHMDPVRLKMPKTRTKSSPENKTADNDNKTR